MISCTVVKALVFKSWHPLLAALLLGGICTASLPAAELPRGEDGHNQTATETWLREKVALWKQRLNLQGWSVSVVVSQKSDLRLGTLGNIHWDPDTKTAVIRVLSIDESQTPSQSALMEMECTVVHELIHLELALLPKSDATRSDEESAVNNLAQALLDLDRADSLKASQPAPAPATP